MIAGQIENLPLDAPVPLWHHPVMVSGTENQFFLSRAASSFSAHVLLRKAAQDEALLA